ncbi:hypothetical protein TraAM80_00853 [Trypanosoma rangeli]|uniref:Uncharacterized protein n=1 Tax=Trypanosoma rangeli TaxID=5698 RepID=A0A422P1B4_TRYRA|nr:uncharacterized protein TraAM80_00853 [Trypanosoma rangeli]RNF11526.1 hypothetical protein TraAM80_00853 [Trypanosoma rangeli]|eukprot:RNF11526.1 hypothetical protein TraAM80_00853 [Trypanosoma rangeli]
MKNTEHIKSLIGELEVYEQELKEKVQQKETELKQLLQRFEPVTTTACFSSSSFSSSAPWRLRIAGPETGEKAGNEADATLSSSYITDERRRIPPLSHYSTGPLGNTHNEKSDRPQKKDTSASIDVDAVSSISHASTSSVDSADALTKAQQLLAAIDTAMGGKPARRVRFASRSPQVVSSVLQCVASVNPAKETEKGKPRGTPLPQSQASQVLREKGGTRVNTVAVPMRGNTISPVSQVALESRDHADSPNRALADDDDKPCYVRRRRRQEEQRKRVQRCQSQASSSDELYVGGNISAAVELTRVTSTSDSDMSCPLRRCRSDSSQLRQVFIGPPAKRRQNSTSPSLSAARPHLVSGTQVEGRGAGIILACGPTLVFD